MRAQDVLYFYYARYIFGGATEIDRCPNWKTLEAALTEAH